MNTLVQINNIKWGFIFQISIIFSLIIVYLFQWLTMISSHPLRTGTDFIIFYSVGKIAQDYGVTRSYDVSLQQGIQEDVIGFPLADKQVLVYNHIPYLIPIISLFVTDDYIFSFVMWTLVMIGIYITTSLLLLNSLSLKTNHLLFFMGIILFYPKFQSLILGQDTAILFFGCTLWFIGMTKQNKWLAAIGLALTSVRPHLCLAFSIPLLFRDFQTGWRFITVSSLLAIISIWMLGSQGVIDFLYMLQISAGGQWYGFHQNEMFNLIGLISRTLSQIEPNSIRIIGWVGYIGNIVFLSFLWGKKENSIEWLICSSIVLTLFFAPHLYYHDLTILIIPLVIVASRYTYHSTILLGISLVLLMFKPLYYIAPYILYFSLLWWIQRKDLPLGRQAL
jgi:hypothetical protein